MGETYCIKNDKGFSNRLEFNRISEFNFNKYITALVFLIVMFISPDYLLATYANLLEETQRNTISAIEHQVKIETDVCVVGAGSAGIGAALAAARSGANVVLVEREAIVGGTSTMSLVSNWEPGPGDSFAREIYNRMSVKKNAVGVAHLVHTYQKDAPYSLAMISADLNYNNSLRRSDLDSKTQCASVLFDIHQFDETVRQMLQETGNCRLLLNTTFTKTITANKSVESIEAVSASGEKYIIKANVFIDCTGNATLCRNAGCEVMLGEESQAKFGEPSAPEVAGNSLNAISLSYYTKKTGNQRTDSKKPEDFNYNVSAHITGPIGESDILTVNPLGIIEGEMWTRLSADSLYEYSKKQVDKHWAKLQTYPDFKDYEFESYAPRPGVRESYRVVSEYILTQHDLLAGLSGQQHPDIISIADHPADLHGRNTSLKVLKDAYGIPYRCLIPENWDNLLVAGRCAGFSHIAASSCRLSRTMMSLGHAAGFAAWYCAKNDEATWNVPVERIQAEMNLKLRQKEELSNSPVPIQKNIGTADFNFYCCDNGNDSIFQISSTGEIVWSYPAKNCQDVWALPNGNILFTYHHGGDGLGGVCEVTKEKEVVFSYETSGEVHTCQRLADGNTLIGVNKNATLIEVDKTGEIRKTIQLKTEKRGHDAIRMARQLLNGNYLVCQEGDKVVAEYNENGDLENTFFSPGKCFEAIRLENGNTLICDGSACSVRELDKKGTVVWQITKDDFPEIKMNWLTGMELLPNGNILVCNWLGHGKYGEGIPVFEVSKDKNIVFYFTDNLHTNSISNLSVVNRLN